MSNVSSRRFSALLAAVAVAVLAMLGLARPATAASPGLPDPSKTANLHITKEATPGTTVGNGTQQDPGNPPIAGVTFTIKQVNTIDLTTQAGWNAADALSTTYNTAAPNNPGDAETAVTGAGYTLGAGSSQTTDAAGKVDFTNLPLGLYLVEETNAPAGVTPSAPFLVTLPLTDPDNLNAWMYDVYVYPKNAITGITKTVDDGNAVKIGDPVVWTINGDIPASTGPGDTVTGYEIKDALDTKLTYDPANPATATLSNGTALMAGTDYNVTFNAGTNTVKVLFTPAGLTKLTANRSAQVVVTIPTVVNAVGVIENVATLFPNQSAIDSDTGVDSPRSTPSGVRSPSRRSTPTATTCPGRCSRCTRRWPTPRTTPTPSSSTAPAPGPPVPTVRSRSTVCGTPTTPTATRWHPATRATRTTTWPR